MLLCHQHKFIFLKTQKTAGTSVEIALSRVMTKDDIVTPLSRRWPWPSEDEKTRQSLGHQGPTNCLAPLQNYTPEELWRLISKGKLKKEFYNHMPAIEAKAKIPEMLWNNYTKISIERNPFDRAISTYYWRTRRSKPSVDINHYIQTCPAIHLSNWNVYTIEDKIAANFMLSYENLSNDLKRLSETLNISPIIELPRERTKGQFRQDKRPWLEVLDQQSIDRIREVCEKEITAFHY